MSWRFHLVSGTLCINLNAIGCHYEQSLFASSADEYIFYVSSGLDSGWPLYSDCCSLSTPMSVVQASYIAYTPCVSLDALCIVYRNFDGVLLTGKTSFGPTANFVSPFLCILPCYFRRVRPTPKVCTSDTEFYDIPVTNYLIFFDYFFITMLPDMYTLQLGKNHLGDSAQLTEFLERKSVVKEINFSAYVRHRPITAYKPKKDNI